MNEKDHCCFLPQVLAELVHKVHLLCLLARGRIIDRVCDDPLIQVGYNNFLMRCTTSHDFEIIWVFEIDWTSIS